MVDRSTEVDIIQCCMINRLLPTHKPLRFDFRQLSTCISTFNQGYISYAVITRGTTEHCGNIGDLVRFVQAEDHQMVTTHSPRIVTDCLLTRSMLTCRPSFAPFLLGLGIWLSLGLSMCPAQTLNTHIALLHLYCVYTWYYTHNATFYYIYFHQSVNKHFPLPSSISEVIWLSLRLCMCLAPTHYIHNGLLYYILRTRGIITIMQHSLTSTSFPTSF